MKIFKILTYFIGVMLLFLSCKKDYLDKAPSVNLPEEKIFSDPVLASEYADNAYNYLVNEYARFNDHRGITGQAADEAVSGNNDVSIRTLNLGTFHDHYERGGSPLNDISDVYARAYTGIRIANMMLSKIDLVKWTAAQSPVRIAGEMHFLRAFLYFELIKRFGGVALVFKPLTANDEINFPRNSYQECLDSIISDLDKADLMLPTVYDNTNYGRATVGASKALRSRLLLYAASDLNNEVTDVATGKTITETLTRKVKWERAAKAAKDVMDMNLYTLQDTYADILNVAQSPEYIMIKIRAPRSKTGFLIDFAMSPGSGGAQGSLNPTQNHVNLYEMQATGKSISATGSGYNALQPYTGRDPRFYANILYNSVLWQGRNMEMWAGGLDYIDNNTNYSITRYYCKKLWPSVYSKNSTGTALVNYLYFRYAEILLNYAEAQNEALDAPDASVYSAINQIRSRPSVNMPPLQSTSVSGPGYVAPTKEAMRDRIRNERAVELAFEDARWYDIMRWKAGTVIVAQPQTGMNVVKNANGSFTYTSIVLPQTFQKVYLDYMDRYPIPRSEIYKSKGVLLQNPGW